MSGEWFFTRKEKVYTRSELEATQELVQRVHDYYEIIGFDIGVYAELSDNGEGSDGTITIRGRELENFGPACYIGGFRLCAGVEPNPYQGNFGSGTADGDGPELGIALKLGDEIARETKAYAKGNIGEGSDDEPGRLLEKLGFYIQRELCDNEAAQNEAIKICRIILTRLYKKLEKGEYA